MTFLNTRYHLTKSLDAHELERLSRLGTLYGIRNLSIEGEDLVVEYDASRIHEAEVLGEIRRSGIGVVPRKPIPPGGFDYSGEFQDFAWPTSGISPVNRLLK